MWICAAVLISVVFWSFVGGFLLKTADWEALVTRIKHEEGFRASVYLDTRGFETIGYGTKLPLLDSERHCLNTGDIDFISFTTDQGDCLLRSRLSTHYDELSHRWILLANQSGPVQMALTDMSYQLGVDGLLEFKLMLGAIAAKNWALAIVEARSSKWDTETPARVERVVKVFELLEQEK